jgi:hypothetical protein
VAAWTVFFCCQNRSLCDDRRGHNLVTSGNVDQIAAIIDESSQFLDFTLQRNKSPVAVTGPNNIFHFPEFP